MSKVEVPCAYCGASVVKDLNAVNRAAREGLNIYCNKAHAGLGRRLAEPRSIEQRKADKKAYDAEYRLKNLAEIKAKKAAYSKRAYDSEKQRAYHQKTMAHHVEYCRRPEYRTYKREYDKEYRAKAEYGDFWECFLLSQSIHEAAVEKAGGWYELALMKGTLNKAIKRRRDYDRLDREEPEVGPLGNLERTQRR